MNHLRFKEHLTEQLQGVTADAKVNGALDFKFRAAEALKAAGMDAAARLVLRLPAAPPAAAAKSEP